MNPFMPIDHQDEMEGSLEDGEKQCPVNNCGNPIADDEETCGDHH